MSSQNSQETEVSGERPILSAASGCLYATYVIVVSGGLLFVNAIFCLTVFASLPVDHDDQVVARAAQMGFFIVPIVLLLVEWNLYDRVRRLFR